jgi:hypothetical protein
MVTNDAYPMDWGSNNLLIYGKSDGYMYTIKPNGDSIIRRAYTTRSPITPYWSPSDHYVTGGSGSLCTKRDLNGNAIYTFPFPFTYARATWIDDNRVTYVTSSSHGDSIHVVDLASGSQANICFISNGMGDTTIHPNDTAVVKFCYDANNNSLYWTSNHYIMRVNLITKEKTVVRRCYNSLHFKEFDFSPAIGKFILVGEEINKKYPCGGSQDYSLYLMNEDGTDLRRINIPE